MLLPESVPPRFSLNEKDCRSISCDWKPEPFGRHLISESRTMKSNLIALLRVTYLDGHRRALRSFKGRLQRLPLRSRKSVFAGSEAVHRFLHHPRRRKNSSTLCNSSARGRGSEH